MLAERQAISTNVQESQIRLLHDEYGRSYQAKSLSSFNDYTLLPYLFRYRSPHLLRCLGINNTDKVEAESLCDLRTGLLINQMEQIDLKEDPAEIVVLFEHLTAVTLRTFALKSITDISKAASDIYEKFFDQILAALENFGKLCGIGLWHGDISPDNIMITMRENAILIDFDKSRLFLPGYTSFVAETDDRNTPFTLSGTPGYSSKSALREQAGLTDSRQKSSDFVHSADRESLGRCFVSAIIKKPGSTLTAADFKSVLSQVQPGFAYKLLSALCAGV